MNTHPSLAEVDLPDEPKQVQFAFDGDVYSLQADQGRWHLYLEGHHLGTLFPPLGEGTFSWAVETERMPDEHADWRLVVRRMLDLR